MDAPWNEKAVFLAALQLRPEDRDAFLSGACPDESARRRIEELLAHHERFGALSDPTGEPTGNGQQVDEFRLIERIGEGGMGVVYLAEDTILGRRVAIKLLRSMLAESPDAQIRFQHEARNAATLSHPAIVPVYKLGFDGRQHYIVSEYVPGRTLAQRIEEERSRRAEGADTADVRAWCRYTAEVVATIADALHHAHRNKVVHRDVKPSNIVIDPDRGPRLTDFGIARQLADETRTATGIIGSVHYMSPEQATLVGSVVDQRSDVFSLGVVLYEMLALQRPFDGATQAEVLRHVIEKDPQWLQAADPRVPYDLAVICHKALEKLVTDRYQSAAHVAADLRSFLDGNAILARPPTLVRRLRRWLGRRRVPVAAAVVAGLVVSAGLISWNAEVARREALAWITIDCPAQGCTVFVEAFDPQTFGYSTAEAIGRTPLRNYRTTPGLYRFIVVAEAGRAFAEVDTPLFARGSAAATQVRVLPESRTALSAEDAAWSREPGRMLAWLAAAEPADDAMLLVPEGDYVYGSRDRDGPLFQRRSVRVSAFAIDRLKVTNAEYRRFVEATGHPQPEHWAAYGDDPTLSEHPIVGIMASDAAAYARWAGKRLPSVVEWQAAARGASGRNFPRGDSLATQPFVYEPPEYGLTQSRDDRTHYELYRRYARPVDVDGGFEDTPEMRQVFGNVLDLTSTWTGDGQGVILSGRSWSQAPQQVTLGDVWTEPRNRTNYTRGFRCARRAAAP